MHEIREKFLHEFAHSILHFQRKDMGESISIKPSGILSSLSKAGFLLEKNFKGGGQKTIDHCFLNNSLLFLLFSVLLFENFRGTKVVLGGAPYSRKPARLFISLLENKLIEMISVYFNTTLDSYYQVTVLIFFFYREEDSFK